MHRLRALRLILQLTLAVMLLGALAPTVSRALAAGRHGPVPGADICSAAAPMGGPLPAPAPDHCPFCLLVAERLGPPPAVSWHFFHADSGLAPLDVQALFFVSLFSLRLSARGPPAYA